VVKIRKDLDGARQIHKMIESGSLLTIHSREPNLEEVFIELTGREF